MSAEGTGGIAALREISLTSLGKKRRRKPPTSRLFHITRCLPQTAKCQNASRSSNRRKLMVRTFMVAAVSIAALALSATAFAQQSGTAAEAKAMLMKAVAAVKADKAKALDMFNKGEGGFLDRDLYVFCG